MKVSKRIDKALASVRTKTEDRTGSNNPPRIRGLRDGQSPTEPDEPIPQENYFISPEALEEDEDDEPSFVSRIFDSIKDFFTGDDDEDKEQPTLRAEEKNPDATVAVFDTFRDADKDGVNTHGEEVEGVIMAQADMDDKDIQRYGIAGKALNKESLDGALEDGNVELFERHVELYMSSGLDQTSDAMEEILQDKDSKITSINQSQSWAEARLVKSMWERAEEEPEFREKLGKFFGFEGNVGDRELLQEMVDSVHEISSESDWIQDSRNHYEDVSKELAEAGITHVVTSGNLGRWDDKLKSLGVETPDDFFLSNLVNKHKTVVAASWKWPDGSIMPAPFNSPEAQADLAANGVNVAVTTDDGASSVVSGTSFAAPKVAAIVAQMKEKNPELTPQEIELILLRTASSQGSFAVQDEGRGKLEAERALAEAS